jgi:hypothetical protein
LEEDNVDRESRGAELLYIASFYQAKSTMHPGAKHTNYILLPPISESGERNGTQSLFLISPLTSGTSMPS